MPKLLLGPTGSIAILAVLLSLGAVDLRTSTAHADDCLTTPKSSAPNGNHWYYRLDSTKQRKCWYLRAAGPPAQPASAQIPAESHNTATSPNAQISINNGIGTSLPHIKMVAVKPQSATTETMAEPVDQSAQEESAASSTPSASPAQASTSLETNALATVPAPIVKPDFTEVGMFNLREPAPALSVARTDSDPATGARASNNAETSARTVPPATTPAELLPIFALGLVVAGFLFRVVMKSATARRRRIIIDCPESYWAGDRQQHGWADNLKHHGSIAEDEFLDGLNRSLISSASDYRPHRPFQTNEQWFVKDPASAVNDQSSDRGDKLDQLRQDLDRMLRSPKVGVS
jgi:hypothetical protein